MVPLINRTSRSCLGKDLRGRLVLKSWRGVSGVLGLARRELERRARALWSLCGVESQLLRFSDRTVVNVEMRPEMRRPKTSFLRKILGGDW